MPRFQIEAARQEFHGEPLVLTLEEEGLETIEVEMPASMPAKLKLAQFENLLSMVDNEQDLEDLMKDESEQLQTRAVLTAFRGLMICLGKPKLLEIMKAGYTEAHLGQIWSVTNFYWQHGELPNPQSGNGSSENGTRSSRTRSRNGSTSSSSK